MAGRVNFMPLRLPPLRRALLATAGACLLLSGCTKSDPATTGSINPSVVEPAGPLAEANALREAGRLPEALAVLEKAAAKNPRDHAVMAAYGRALAAAGRGNDALLVLAKADPKRRSWQILNSEGAILDSLGRLEEAQARYAMALRLAPGEPLILSNLGLSQALADRPAEAEATLRQAAAHPAATAKVRQNLALVLAVQGKFDEAEAIARKDLSAEEAAANVRYWRRAMKPASAAKPASAQTAAAPG
jgi:Flp pilus assembly protein TadD